MRFLRVKLIFIPNTWLFEQQRSTRMRAKHVLRVRNWQC